MYEIEEFCQQLGLRLKRLRLLARQTQEELATRIGVSRRTIMAMEAGNPSVALGTWLKASYFLDALDTWQEVLSLAIDPFEEYDKKIHEIERIRKARVRKAGTG